MNAAAIVDADFVDEGFDDGLDLAGVGAADRLDDLCAQCGQLRGVGGLRAGEVEDGL
ncbi:MAG TPA: hypothetical protein VMU51_12225 [Mycobacteriales bacterium]|nr:hypothetical protein [Mycobacteriales bacterium]